MAISFNVKSLVELTATPKKSTFTLAIGSVLMILLMVIVAIRPAVVSVFKQISNNSVRRELISMQNVKIQALHEMIGQQTKYGTEIELFNEAFPDFDDTEFVVANLNSYAKNNQGIQIESMEIDFQNGSFESSGLEIYPGTGSYGISIGFLCDVEQSIQFLEYINQFPRILNVKTVSFAPIANDRSLSLPIQGQLELMVYYKQPSEQIIDTELSQPN